MGGPDTPAMEGAIMSGGYTGNILAVDLHRQTTSVKKTSCHAQDATHVKKPRNAS